MGHPHERITDYRGRIDSTTRALDAFNARRQQAVDMVDATITATRKRLSAAEVEGRTDDVEEQGAYLRGLLFARECFVGPVADPPCPHVIHVPVGDPTREMVTTWVCRRCGDPYPHK